MSMMDKPTAERIRVIAEAMKGSNFKNLRSIIFKYLTGDVQQFTHKFNGHIWKGYKYQTRNSLMGTLFSYWDNKPFIVRGYPKIRYTENTTLIDKECFCEEKIDGTNLGLFFLPNGLFMGKTRMVERFDLQGFKGRNWSKLLNKTELVPNIQSIIKDDYTVFGELYGKENPGDFISYSSSIAFKGFDIVDLRTFTFLSPIDKSKLFYDHDIPTPQIIWQGEISPKEIERLEFELIQVVKEDGMEGLVAKYWNVELQDTQFGKIKTGSIKELAWSLSPRKTIPRGLIGKAVRKAWEANKDFNKQKEILDFVKEELLEEFDDSFVSHSSDKIKRMIQEYFTSMQGDIRPEVFDYLKELEESGITVNMETKGKIMPILAKKFIGYTPNKLYGMYLTYVNK